MKQIAYKCMHHHYVVVSSYSPTLAHLLCIAHINIVVCTPNQTKQNETKTKQSQKKSAKIFQTKLTNHRFRSVSFAPDFNLSEFRLLNKIKP